MGMPVGRMRVTNRMYHGPRPRSSDAAQSVLLVSFLCLSFFGGCSLDDLKPRKAGRETFVLNNGSEPQTLDPALMTGVPEMTVAEALFEGLTAYDPKTLAPVPAAAESWEVSADGLRYTFHLRRCFWSDGTPVTAHDFVYAWERVLRPETAAQYAYQLFYIKNGRAYNSGTLKDFSQVGVRASDERTLVVELEAPTPFFVSLTSFGTLYPVKRECVERHGDSWTRPGNLVGNGAFVLREWRQNRYILLERNAHYWEPARMPRIKVLAVDNSDTALKMYITGEVDYLKSVPALKVPILRKRPDCRCCPYLGISFLRVNVTRKPLSDPRVRHALSLAIDREAICRNILRGGHVPAVSFTPPGLPGYEPPKRKLSDPEVARRLLAEAGYPVGRGFPEIRYLYNTSETHRQIAVEIQDAWRRNLGIRVSLVNQEWKVYLKTIELLDYDVARGGWIGDYLDPNTFLDLFVTGGGNNRTGWSNADYDRHIRAAARSGGAERVAHFHRAESILLDEMPVIPLYYSANVYLVRPDVEGLYDNILDVHPMKYLSIKQP